MSTKLDVEVSYGQLAVFASSLTHPFNEWTDQHVSQGFSWRPGSVSFRTLAEAGRLSVEIAFVKHVGTVRSDAARVVEVPFEVPPDGAIEVGSIGETTSLSLPVGSFLLRCEFLQPNETDGEQVRMTFAEDDMGRFTVVRADAELNVSRPLLTTSKPAID